MDIIAPCLMIGLGFGRIGCFLNGCCHGAECNLPWAVTFPYHSNAYVDQFRRQEHPLPVPPALVEATPTPRAPRLIARSTLRRMGPQYVELASAAALAHRPPRAALQHHHRVAAGGVAGGVFHRPALRRAACSR